MRDVGCGMREGANQECKLRGRMNCIAHRDEVMKCRKLNKCERMYIHSKHELETVPYIVHHSNLMLVDVVAAANCRSLHKHALQQSSSINSIQ
jgi:hypothetical protein